MANPRTLATSFHGGELTPEFYGRIEDAKYQSGLATCRNFEVLPHGPVRNRAGFMYVNSVKDSTKSTRLIQFVYSTTQTMVLELGNGYIRFHTQGATLLNLGVPYEVSTPYATADLFDIHYTQSSDVMTLVHPNYAPMELRRLGSTSWTLTAITFATTMAAPANPTVAATVGSGGTNLVLCEYCVTAVSTDGYTESLASISALGPISQTISAITQANPGVFTLFGAPTISIVAGQQVTITGVVGMTQLNGNVYLVKTVNAVTYQFGLGGGALSVSTLKLINIDGTDLDTTGFSAYASAGTMSFAGVMNNLFVTGSANSVTWPSVVGAGAYNVYKKSQGLFSYIGQTKFTWFKDDSIAPDISKTPPINNNPLGSAGNYPGAVTYYQQRRCFAGTTNSPSSIWMTKSGTESNLNYSLPSRADDSIQFKVAAREANTIRHMIPLTSLVLLTSAAEWRVTSVNSDALTPSSFSVTPQSYVGANNAQPIVVNNSMLYAAGRGGHIRELGYSWQAQGYVTGDTSLRAPHLFDGYDIVDMAFAKAPYPYLWATSSSGKLLGFTYVPEQQLGAWHQHDSGTGIFESVCVVAEGGRDVLYCVVRRATPAGTVRFVERQASRLIGATDYWNWFFVDCGLTYSGAPATTISGFTHLEGQLVSILADGAVVAPQTVVGGAIKLPVAASYVTVGLQYTSDIQTLPLVLPMPGYGQGRPKNVTKAFIRVKDTRGLKAGPDTSHLVEHADRKVELYGSPPSLQNGEIPMVLPNSWTDSGQVYIRQDQPLPATIIDICYEVALGG